MTAVISPGGAPQWANPGLEDPAFEEIGIPMTRDMAGDAASPERGDVFSADARVAVYDRAHELRHDSLLYRHHNNKPIERDFGGWFLSGDLGSGKSVYCGAHLYAYYIFGLSVVHNATFLYGRRISGEEFVTIGEAELSNYAIFGDEIHSLVERMGAASWAHRLFRNSGALQRKDAVRAFFASAEEGDVGYPVLRACQWIKYPYYWSPGALDMSSGRGRSVPRGRRRKGPTLPPFCYVSAVKLGPNPVRKRRHIDEFIPNASGPGLSYEPLLDPALVYESAHLMDTWQKPSIAASMELTAQRLRAHRAGQDEDEGAMEAADGPDLWECITSAHRAGLIRLEGKRSVSIEHVNRGARLHGYQGDDQEFKTLLRAEDLLTQRGAVRVRDLRDMLELG